MAASWECPALPMIVLSLKDTTKTTFLPLKSLIASHYEESAESFLEEIKQLDQLRENAVRPSRDHSGCTLLRRYYAQLHMLLSRFPQETAGKIPVNFTWKDMYTGSDVSHGGLLIEMAAILCNIGAIHSQLGGKDTRHNEQEMKDALTHFQCSAGSYAYLQEHASGSGCADLSPQLVEMYKNLMLGQAQECIVEKSLKGISKVKNLNISKLSIKVAQYYQSVITVLESDVGATAAKKHKDWIKLLQIKSTYYTAVAHLYQAQSLEEQGNYGYMIAYHQLAVQKIQSLGKLPRGVPDAIRDTVKNFTEYITAKLSESIKQNDQVYHELIPNLDTLEPAPGVELVKPVVFQPVDRKSSGSDILARLVPMKAYEAASLYSEEKAKILRSLSSSVEEKDEDLSKFMSSLNIEEISKSNEDQPSLPGEVMSHHKQLQSKEQNIKELQKQLNELMDLSRQVDNILILVSERREEELKEEKEFQERHGPRPESQVCGGIWRELDSLSKYHKQASKSNGDLKVMFDQGYPNFMLLAGPTYSLLAAIPTRSLVESDKSSGQRWRELLAKVEEMKQQRKSLMAQLRDQINNDDITRLMIGEANQGSIMEEHLAKHREKADVIRQNLTAQDNILKELTKENAKRASLRQASQDQSKRQEEFFVNLAKSAVQYSFLSSKIQEGLGFYTKLMDSVSKLQKRCTDVCNTRRKDRENVERRTSSPALDKVATSSSIATPSSNVATPSSNISTPPSNVLVPNRPHKKAELRGEPLNLPTSIPTEEPQEALGPQSSNEVSQLIESMKAIQEQQIAALDGSKTTPNNDVPSASLQPVPSASLQPTPNASLQPMPSASLQPVPNVSLQPMPTASLQPVPSTSLLPMPNASLQPVPSASMQPVPSNASLQPVPSASLQPMPSALQPVPSTAVPDTVSTSSNLPLQHLVASLHPDHDALPTNQEEAAVGASILPTNEGTLQPTPLLSGTGQPTSLQSEMVQPIPPQSEMTQPMPPQSEMVQPIPPQSEVVQPISPQSEVVQPIPPQSEVVQPIPPQSEVVQPIPPQSEVVQPIPPQSGMPSIEVTSQHATAEDATSTPSALSFETNVPPSGPLSNVSFNGSSSIDSSILHSGPSSIGSNVPSSGPSSIVSNVPSNVTSSISSNVPSTIGSNVPPNVPSTIGSNVPSTIGSNVPPNVPSTIGYNVPPNVPSSIGSNVPPNVPSSIGSNVLPNVLSSIGSNIPPNVPSSIGSNALYNVPSSIGSNVPPNVPSFIGSNVSPSVDSNLPSSGLLSIGSNVLPSTSAIGSNGLPSTSVHNDTVTTSSVGQPSLGRLLNTATPLETGLDTLDAFTMTSSSKPTRPSHAALPGGVFIPPPPLSVTSDSGKTTPSTPTISYFENLLMQQQQTIQSQTRQIEEQKDQLQQQGHLLDEKRKELEEANLQLKLQEKDKVSLTSHQSMLVNLLQQQQGLFTHQQSQMDKINQEGEDRRRIHTDTEMKLREALAREQMQNQVFLNDLTQSTKDSEHLKQQLQSVNQQLTSMQTQAQQYLAQIQERDKVLNNYREEHRRIVEGMEAQYRPKVQQLTQQVQDLQAELAKFRSLKSHHGGPHSSHVPHGVPQSSTFSDPRSQPQDPRSQHPSQPPDSRHTPDPRAPPPSNLPPPILPQQPVSSQLPPHKYGAYQPQQPAGRLQSPQLVPSQQQSQTGHHKPHPPAGPPQTTSPRQHPSGQPQPLRNQKPRQNQKIIPNQTPVPPESYQGPPQVPQGSQVSPGSRQQPQVPQGFNQHPQGSHAPQGSRQVPHGSQITRGSHQVPQGSQVPPQGSQSSQAPQHPQVLQGPHQVPQGSQVPQGLHHVPQGSHQVPQASHKVPQGSQVPQGSHPVPQSSQVPQGPHQVPQGSQQGLESPQQPHQRFQGSPQGQGPQSNAGLPTASSNIIQDPIPRPQMAPGQPPYQASPQLYPQHQSWQYQDQRPSVEGYPPNVPHSAASDHTHNGRTHP